MLWKEYDTVTSAQHEPRRARLVFTLGDGRHRAGEIPLAALARIASETQTLVRRLARSLNERGGPGRTPAAIEDATELMLVGVGPGSTRLELVGPVQQPQLDLDLDIPDDIGTRALDGLLTALEAVARHEPLPVAVDDISGRSLEDWLAAMAASASDLKVEVSLGGRPARTVDLVPAVARAELNERRAARSAPPVAPMRAVDGRLYAVDLDSGRYRIRDDEGNSIAVVTTGLSRDDVAPLLDQRVRAEGASRFDEQGRLHSLEVTSLSLAPDVEGLDTASFFAGAELDQLSGDARPLESMSELTIAELTATDVADLRAGHAIGQKLHDGDRWVAATAIRYGVPLVSHDGIFRGAPGLRLITELEETAR
jgi:hypothetical protein